MNHLYLIPQLDNALAHLSGEIRLLRQVHPLAPARVLLPTGRSTHYAQRQLGDTLNIKFDQFLALAQSVLAAANRPVQRLDETSQRHLVRHLLAEMAGQSELSSFAAVYQKPGFVQTLLEWLQEMKSQSIWPEMIAAEAARSRYPRDQQLALLYQRYQSFLQQRDLADNDGLLWLAAEALEDDLTSFNQQAPLFVLGFDQFNPTQLRLLKALAGRLPALTVYLLWDDSRADDDLVLTRLQESRLALEDALNVKAQLLNDGATTPPATLTYLKQRLLRDTPASEPTNGANHVLAVAAPSREAEVRWLLRDIKRLLGAGVKPTEIAVLAPNPTLYRRLVSTVASEYKLSIPVPEPLRLNPAVNCLLNLLQLAPDFPWRLTLECLRSPYVTQPWLDESQLQLLGQLTRERPVVAGRAQWLFALRHLDLNLEEREDEDLGPLPLVAKLPAEELDAISIGVNSFFDLVTPPRSATPGAFVEWLESWLLWSNDEGDSLALIERCADEERTAGRDQAALALVLRNMRQLLSAAELTNERDSKISWEAFRTSLLELIPEARGPEAEKDSGIFLGALEDARSQQVDHLYVLGLSEGEFPRSPTPDIFYDPQERENYPLPLVRYQPAESATLWWQLLASPRQKLTLLRPRIDESGALWVPSPYWDATCSLLNGFPLRELALAPQPEVAEAARESEWLNGLAAANATAVPATLQAGWQAATLARHIEEQRQSWQPPGNSEGIILAPDIQAELASRYRESHHWSASRLNRYGVCPYGFFARHILKLEEKTDPEEGFDAMQRGSLLHAILETLFQRLTAASLKPTPENELQILSWLEQCCDALFAGAPLRYGFREGTLWRYEQQEIRRLLRRLVQWECSGETYGHNEPVYQELRFGFPGDELPPLSLSVGDITFKMHGVIDRIDRAESGELHIIDYKSGRTPYTIKDVEEGRSLQVVLYRRAAEDLLPQLLAGPVAVVSSRYLHLPNRATSGDPQARKVAEMNEKAIEQAAYFVSQVRAGVFPSAPGKVDADFKACRAGCSLAPLCRVSRQSVGKWRRQ